jgi:hypothetical protein
MINDLLNQSGIKCFVLSNKECPHCEEWMQNSFDVFKNQFDNVAWHVIDCYEEHQAGRMPFPPLASPTFYLYKDPQDFPIISAGFLPEPEMTMKFKRLIEAVKND